MNQKSQLITVIVTGIGAIIGQGIIKSLRHSKYSVRVIGIDRSDKSLGPSLCDEFYQKPPCDENSQDYLEFWSNLLEKEKVDIILPGLEIDMLFLDLHRNFFNNLDVAVAINNCELIALSSDKWLQGEKLPSVGLPQIPSLITDNWHHAISVLGQPPLLLKPRDGNGSRGIAKLYDRVDFDYWRMKSGNNWMLQKLIGDDSNEFTVGVFGLGDGTSIQPITFKRRLSSAGNTLEAQVTHDRLIEEASQKLTKYFKPIGPTNYQFRTEDNKVFLLEINPRFSSSNSIRTAFGYNEAEMSIDFFFFKKTPLVSTIRTGIAWRYSEDFVQYDSNTF